MCLPSLSRPAGRPPLISARPAALRRRLTAGYGGLTVTRTTRPATGTRREDEITTYQLSTYPQTSADDLRLYREAGLTIEHSEQNDRSSRAYQRAYAVINTEDVEFDVYLDASGGALEPELLNLAEAVLSRIVELDAAARAVQTDPRYEESLAYVDITVNTEWGAYFVRDEQGGALQPGSVSGRPGR